jgi:hypothetical protein
MIRWLVILFAVLGMTAPASAQLSNMLWTGSGSAPPTGCTALQLDYTNACNIVSYTVGVLGL